MRPWAWVEEGRGLQAWGATPGGPRWSATSSRHTSIPVQDAAPRQPLACMMLPSASHSRPRTHLCHAADALVDGQQHLARVVHLAWRRRKAGHTCGAGRR